MCSAVRADAHRREGQFGTRPGDCRQRSRRIRWTRPPLRSLANMAGLRMIQAEARQFPAKAHSPYSIYKLATRSTWRLDSTDPATRPTARATLPGEEPEPRALTIRREMAQNPLLVRQSHNTGTSPTVRRSYGLNAVTRSLRSGKTGPRIAGAARAVSAAPRQHRPQPSDLAGASSVSRARAHTLTRSWLRQLTTRLALWSTHGSWLMTRATCRGQGTL
jgi:hypothetical protein